MEMYKSQKVYDSRFQFKDGKKEEPGSTVVPINFNINYPE